MKDPQEMRQALEDAPALGPGPSRVSIGDKAPSCAGGFPKEKAKQPPASQGASASKQKVRFRNKLYERIRVSVRTMDVIITVTVILLVAAVAVGILLGRA